VTRRLDKQEAAAALIPRGMTVGRLTARWKKQSIRICRGHSFSTDGNSSTAAVGQDLKPHPVFGLTFETASVS